MFLIRVFYMRWWIARDVDLCLVGDRIAATSIRDIAKPGMIAIERNEVGFHLRGTRT